MSGGYFDYDQYKIGEVADQIRKLVERNERQTFNKEEKYSAETIARFIDAEKTLRLGEIMAQRIDWLESGDDSEKTFHERWFDDMRGFWSNYKEPSK